MILIEIVLKPSKKLRVMITFFLYIFTFCLFILIRILIFEDKWINFVFFNIGLSFGIYAISYIICLIKIKDRKIIHTLLLLVIFAQILGYCIYVIM